MRNAYDGKLKSIEKNPFAKVPKDKKLTSGKEVNSIFPLTLVQIKPPQVDADPLPGSGP